MESEPPEELPACSSRDDIHSDILISRQAIDILRRSGKGNQRQFLRDAAGFFYDTR